MNMYHYTESGLDDVYLANGFQEIETKYGSAVSVQDAAGLHKVIGEILIEKPNHLDGNELRFLRKELGFSQKRLSEILGNTEQAVANWEKGKNEISKAADMCVRGIYIETVLEENAEFMNLVATIVDTDRIRSENQNRTFVANDRWELQEDDVAA